MSLRDTGAGKSVVRAGGLGGDRSGGLAEGSGGTGGVAGGAGGGLRRGSALWSIGARSGRKARRAVARTARAVEGLEKRTLYSATLQMLASPVTASSCPCGCGQQTPDPAGSRPEDLGQFEVLDNLPSGAGADTGGGTAGDGTVSGGTTGNIPISQLPIWNSNPTATAKLYLDFTGDAGGAWGNYIVTTQPAFDTDGDATTFSPGEIATIQEIFNRVAEKYSPFNINITTQDPGTLVDKVSAKVVISGNSGWYTNTTPAGGVAYVGAFQNFRPNVAWVFSNMLYNDPRYIGEAAAHEAGHMFALNHQRIFNADGTVANEYNPGSGDKAPIMGNSYYATRGLWWSGYSSSSTTIQDDLAVLSGTGNGFGYRADDYGNTTGTATAIALSNGTGSRSGVITTTSDIDAFSFTVSTAGQVTINGAVAAVGPTLDLTLELYNSAGQLLTSAATSSLGETIVQNLGVGTYYVLVKSAGGYGDVGTYTLSVQTPVGTSLPTPPVASAGGPYTVGEGGTVLLSASGSTGTGLTYAWDLNGDGVYGDVSSNATRGSESGVSVTFSAAGLNGPGTYNVSLRVIDSAGQTSTVTVPVTITDVVPTVTITGATTGTEGSPVTIGFSATDPGNDTINQWIVTWGDGTTSTFAGTVNTASKTYGDNGNYTVTVTAVTADGNGSSTRTLAIANVPPTLSLNVPTGVNEGSAYTYSWSASDPGTDTISGWRITWGDGTTSTFAGNVTSASKTYADNGSYTITLWATDEDGTYSITQTATVANVAPTLALNVPTGLNEGTGYSFSWSASDPGTDTISSWRITWGDGTTSTYAGNVTSATKTYADNGSYTITLYATDEDGTYSTTRTANVANVAPTLGLTVPTGLNEGSSYTYSWSASDPGTDTVSSWRITWGDGTTSTFAGNVTSATKTYADNGSYTVTLWATDEDGTYSTTATANVANVAPTLSLTVPGSINEGSAASFSWSASDPGTDTVSSWRITWGDGTTSTYAGNVTSATKTYADNGSYTVTLWATDEDGTYSSAFAASVANVAPTLSLNVPGGMLEGSAYTFSWGATDPGTDTVSSWQITWGDGTTSTYAGNVTSASKTYADNGSYTITLWATDEDGTYSITQTATVANVAPTLTVTVGPTSVTTADVVTVTVGRVDPGADTVSSWVVNWGDGTSTSYTGALVSAQRVYSTPGTYAISVSVTDEDGTYSAAATSNLTVTAAPLTVAVSQVGTAAQEGSPVTVNFSASGTQTVTGWVISWGDGTSVNLPAGSTSATRTYADNGSYVVTATAATAVGSYSNQTTVAVANVAPTLGLTVPTGLNEGSSYTYSWSASDPGTDTVSSWRITWGDGTTSTFAGNVTSATKTYADNGSYTVTLWATDEDGTYSTTATANVANVAPTLSLTVPGSINEGSAASFSWSASDPGTDTVSSWRITWGDGTTSTYAGNVTSATKTYADNGSYTVTLWATDEDGTYSITRTASVANVAPTLGLSLPGSINEGSAYTYSWSASDPGTDTVSSWRITWGDGTTSTFAGNVTSASKTYADNGSYTITLFATDEDGTYSTTATANVANVAPTLSLTVPTGMTEGSSYTFSWGATDPGNDTVSSWRITWGDGTTGTYAGNVTSATKTYADNGNYTVTLYATDEDGTFSTAKTAAVANVAPTLSLNLPSNALEGTPATFTWSAADPGTDTISSWRINWGDGTSSTYTGITTSANKTYADNGSYTITLTAVDEDGSYSTTGTVAVANVAPTISLSGADTVVAGRSYTLGVTTSDPGADTISRWSVDWGDGTVSNYTGVPTGVSRTYATAGSYQIKVSVTDEDGTWNATPKSLTVSPAPLTVSVAPATSNAANGSNGSEGSPLTVNFSATGGAGAASVTGWTINWGDGTSSTYAGNVTSATKTYADNGTYAVVAVATTTGGTFTGAVNVLVADVAPTLGLTVPQGLKAGTAGQFAFSATDVGADTVSQFSIDWGDGTSGTFAGTATSAGKTYATPGTYSVRLTAVNEDGSFSLTSQVTVAGRTPQITAQASSSQGGTASVSFAATGSGVSPVTGWVVDWGNGATSTLAPTASSATTTYASNGDYTVTVSAINADGTFSTAVALSVNTVAPDFSLTAPQGLSQGSAGTFTWTSDPVITGWSLSWGDGTTSTFLPGVTSFSKVYTGKGGFTVTLTATGAFGSKSVSQAVTVADVAPTISARSPDGVTAKSPFTFSLTATDPGNDPVTGWSVNWGDGTTTTLGGGFNISAEKVYLAAGTYTLVATAQYDGGSVSREVRVVVGNPLVEVQNAAPVGVRQGTAFALPLSTVRPPSVAITAWRVDWGDGTTSTLDATATSAGKVYNASGVFTVQVFADTAVGTFSSSLQLPVAAAAPTISATFPGNLYTTSSGTLTLSSGNPASDGITGWVVNWGDGTTTNVSTPTASLNKSYNKTGTYTISVVAQSAAGDVSTTLPVSVTKQLVSARFSKLSQGKTATVSLGALPDASTDGSVTRWQVAWSDGSVSNVTGSTPTLRKIFRQSGNLNAVVTAFTAGGSSFSQDVSFVVQDTPPKLTLAGPRSGRAGSVARFSLNSVDFGDDRVTNWLVDWGDGTTSTLDSFRGQLTKVFASAGVYQVTATAQDANGSYAAKPLTIKVAAPVAKAATNAAVKSAVSPFAAFSARTITSELLTGKAA